MWMLTKRLANTLLALLVVSVVINYLDRGALSVAAPRISRELSLSPTQMGVLFSAFFWSYATFQLVAGWLVDRYPLRWVYAGAFLIWSLATAAVGMVESLGALLGARLLLGVGRAWRIRPRRRSWSGTFLKGAGGWRTLWSTRVRRRGRG